MKREMTYLKHLEGHRSADDFKADMNVLNVFMPHAADPKKGFDKILVTLDTYLTFVRTNLITFSAYDIFIWIS